jgi:hypothetical protein
MQKRRERINERLRVLQNLVPNGTKVSLLKKKIVHSNYRSKTKGDTQIKSKICVIWQVDISTMLEAAAQYVKFLQLQIKVWHSQVLFNFILNAPCLCVAY